MSEFCLEFTASYFPTPTTAMYTRSVSRLLFHCPMRGMEFRIPTLMVYGALYVVRAKEPEKKKKSQIA